MTLIQVWGALLIFMVCPLLGGLPLTGWVTQLAAGRQLAQLGTGNIGVSAAFYHGGKIAGILAVIVEASKGIVAVLLARAFFPQDPTWELIALIALVTGRYWIGRGAGTTNAAWGYVVYDWVVALLVFLIGGLSFTILRERQQGRIGVLLLVPLITALHRQSLSETVAAIALCGLIARIYQKLPDDLDLSPETSEISSQKMFKFFQGNRAVLSLDQSLSVRQVGQKAATLSQLKRWGYPVPKGWVLPAGDDPEPLIELLHPTPEAPLVVRSSAVGEDSEQASAAGQYQTILHVTSRSALREAITVCQAFYDQPRAVQYRQDRGVPEANMAVLVQIQIQGVFSGVAFSRDPMQGDTDVVTVEALPGEASRIVSGQTTPERYRVRFSNPPEPGSEIELQLERETEAGDVPPQLIRQVALLARDLEARYYGVPQDIEWSYDGRTLWVLQARPITTLLPIWTRKIAAEVIPGLIHPLTWSINRPLTCGVWGDIFTLVLGERARGLNFNQTATLHFSRAYFNASLLGQSFRRMGLPPESLEFLTRGARLSKPSLRSTLRNVPGLLRLLRRELRLHRDFEHDNRQIFIPLLNTLQDQPAKNLAPPSLIERIESIFEALQRATYYSILAPLSASLRQALFRIKDEKLDNSSMPEVAALRSLSTLARAAQPLLANAKQPDFQPSRVFAILAESPEGLTILKQLDQLIDRYGYLSDVATDIAVPTWHEDPRPIYDLFAGFLLHPPAMPGVKPAQGWLASVVQQRVQLKGHVAVVYNRLLAELRWCFVALEQAWLHSGLLAAPGDIFFLEWHEVREIAVNPNSLLIDQVPQRVARRRSQFQQDSQLASVPPVVYGNTPPAVPDFDLGQPWQQLRGIGASPGQAVGQVKVLRNLQAIAGIDRNTILVVPYTDAGWAPLLARAGGLIAEVGGRLSHGAIVAREYGIPAVMEIANATQRLQDGQQVHIDGQQGTVDIL